MFFSALRRLGARPRSSLVPVAVAAVVVFTASAGEASEHIPAAVQDQLSMGCAPTCLLCHTVMTGGADFLNPFGTSMDEQGLVAGEGGVRRVFGPEGTGFGTDFDEDGVSDADELIANTDPAVPGEEAGPVCSDATYGCGARVTPEPPTQGSGWGVLLALAVATALWRQRRGL